MSVLMTMRLHGDAAGLEKVAAADPTTIQDIAGHAEGHGLISHQFWAAEGDILVVDEWDSRENFESFFATEDTEIRGLMDSAGVTEAPEITYWRKLDTHDGVDHGRLIEQRGTAKARPERSSFDRPEETRKFEAGMGRMDLLHGSQVGRGTYEPGWRWSTHVKPIAGTATCQVSHMGYVVAGRMVVAMEDGEQVEFSAGDFMTVPPGHDAWVLGDEACVLIDWQGASGYAKR
jgi:hypothetical protein